MSRDCLILVSTTEDGLTSCQMVAYPTMIKVSCVGDGEGIRRVHNGEEAKVLFKKAQGEEPGSPIFILKVATQYRHLKVQQLCDKYENVAALHSRDFNVQRRHQKVSLKQEPSCFFFLFVSVRMSWFSRSYESYESYTALSFLSFCD